MKILALDLGTKCGYAVSGGPSGVWDCTPGRFDTRGQRFVKFERAIIDIILKHQPDLIVYEEVRAHMGVDAAHIYGGFVSLLQVMGLKNRVEYRGVSVGVIKKHATGKGNAKKPDMIKAAARLFPAVNVIDDNHADALCLLHYALQENTLQ